MFSSFRLRCSPASACKLASKFALSLMIFVVAVASSTWAAPPAADKLGIIPAKGITVGGTKIRPAAPPQGLKNHPDLGIITAPLGCSSLK